MKQRFRLEIGLIRFALHSPRISQSLFERQAGIMSVCSLVIDKVFIRTNGVNKMRIGRIIIGFEDPVTSQITFDSKYVHYSPDDYVHDEFCFKYNGIDRNTISNQGERYSVVMDWARAAIRAKTVIVCGTADLDEVLAETPCYIVNLQDFFYNMKAGGIIEPISLNRLCSRIFGEETHAVGRRDPLKECRNKIALFHVMKGFKAGKVSPPFEDSFFPKVPKHFLSAPPAAVRETDEWMVEDVTSRLSRCRAKNSINEETEGQDDANEYESMDATRVKDDKREAAKRDTDVEGKGRVSRCTGRGMSSHPLYEDLIQTPNRKADQRCVSPVERWYICFKPPKARVRKRLHAFIACAVDTTDH